MGEDFTALLSAAVSAPVHWRMQPTLQKVYPYVNLTAFSFPTTYHVGGESDAREITIQVDCWGRTYSEAVTLSRAVYAALSGFNGQQGGTYFHGIFFDGERDLGGDVVDEERGRIHARSGDYRVAYS